MWWSLPAKIEHATREEGRRRRRRRSFSLFTSELAER